MTSDAGEERFRLLCRAACGMLLVASWAHVAGRIGSLRHYHLERVPAENGTSAGDVQLVGSPLFSANDRSRWCTIRALVDHGTYQIDQVIRDPETRRWDSTWYTIDMVRHRGWDGKEHYYSSKPPLLATLLAGPYWLLSRLTGVTLESHPFYVVRVLLILVNLIPLAAYFWMLWRITDRYAQSHWGQLLTVAAAAWGTFLTTFAITLNNHLLAAFCVLAAVSLALPVWNGESRSWFRFGLAGLFAALATTNELPALSFAVLLGCGLAWRSPVRTMFAYVPCAALIAFLFLGTNYAAHGSWRLPYMHRSDGPLVATPAARDDVLQTLTQGGVPEAVRTTLGEAGFDVSAEAVLLETDDPERWVLWDRQGHDRFAIRHGGKTLNVHLWDNWYEYERSYWTDDRKVGVDRGEPDRGVYAFHMLLGHHGFFALTPVWLIGLLGIGVAVWRRDDRLSGVLCLTLVLTLVCLAFYVARPLKDRNYGGVTCGFRWLFWLIPLWLCALQRGADRLSENRWLRGLGWLALAVSVFSAVYGNQNPWSQPWLFDYWSNLGWIDY